jgi:hypothetical protein
MSLASRYVMLRGVPKDVSTDDVPEKFEKVATVRQVTRLDDTMYLVLENHSMVERAMSSLQGLSVGKWSLYLELAHSDREMLLDSLVWGGAGSGPPEGEADAEGDKNVCSEMIALFSHLSANDRSVFLQAVCSSQSSPIGLSAGSVSFVSPIPQSSVPLVTAPFPRLSQFSGDQGKSEVSLRALRALERHCVLSFTALAGN